jgi:hypothetical protein
MVDKTVSVKDLLMDKHHHHSPTYMETMSRTSKPLPVLPQLLLTAIQRHQALQT